MTGSEKTRHSNIHHNCGTPKRYFRHHRFTTTTINVHRLSRPLLTVLRHWRYAPQAPAGQGPCQARLIHTAVVLEFPLDEVGQRPALRGHQAREGRIVLCNKLVKEGWFRAMAFFRISRSAFSVLISRLSAVISACSGLRCPAPGNALTGSARYNRTHLRNTFSCKSRSRAAWATGIL